MSLKNEWIGYLERTYDQLSTAIDSKLAIKIPEIKDISQNNPIIRLVNIWKAFVENIQYYVDKKGREAFLASCQLFSSGYKVARQFDYRIKGYGAARATVTFTTDGALGADLVIPAGTRLETDNGTPFYTLTQLTIPSGQSQGFVEVEQYDPISNQVLGQSDETVGQQFSFDTANVVDKSVEISINSVNWTGKETFAFSTATEEHFVQTQNKNGEVIVEFGDDENGKIPAAGFDILASYKITIGKAGNDIGPDTITNIIDSITVPGGLDLTVTNAQRATGGFDKETLARLKRNIPKFNRTSEVAITKQDFIDVAELMTGVAKAGVDYNCGTFVDVFIAPEGSGQPSQLLLDDTLDWFNDGRAVFSANLQIKPAGTLRMKHKILLKVKANYVGADVVTAVRNTLLDFYSVDNQKIKGAVELGDVYEKVETTPGVSSSDILKMVVEPYARPLNNTTNTLTWTPVIKEASTGAKQWLIQFTGANSFIVSRAGEFLGNFVTGTEVDFTEIKFTITGSYTLDDQFEFWTYKSFGSIDVQEPSYVYAEAADLEIIATGGIS